MVTFCHKKGITISKGRPKGESRIVTITSELYQEVLSELKEELKEETPTKKTI